MSYNFDDPAYDDFLKDERVGHQDFMVSAIENGTFPESGDSYRRLKGVLTTAGNATIDYTFGQIPPPSELAKQKTLNGNDPEKWNDRKTAAIKSAISQARQFIQHYGKTPDEAKVGDVYRVNVIKNKDGYVRIVAFLPASEIGQKSAAAGADMGTVPF